MASFLLAWLLVAAQLAGGVFVLCVSAKGHVEVETIGSPCCMEALAGGSGTSIGIDDSACSGCADTSLLTSVGGQSSERQSVAMLPAVGLALAANPQLAPIARSSCDLAPSLFAGTPSLPLRC